MTTTDTVGSRVPQAPWLRALRPYGRADSRKAVIQLPVILIAAMMGIWLFYIQHQYPGVYWARDEAWDPVRAAMEGSSYYRLPRWLQWVSGNIGLHHIHHLRPTIPNYNLQACYDAVPEVRTVKPLTLSASLQCLGLALYDENQRRLIRFRDAGGD